jgi:PAS domain S-box-containing protein
MRSLTEAKMKNAKRKRRKPGGAYVIDIHDRKKTGIKRKTAPALRKRAEKKLTASPQRKTASSIDALKLVHELQVHQIELEMQNEELQSAKREVEESRARFSDLYDFSPAGYVTLDEKGTVVEANLTFARMMGINRGALLNRPFHLFVSSEDKDAFLTCFQRLGSSDGKTTFETRLVKKDHSVFHVQMESTGLMNAENVRQFLLAILDITERVHAKKLLAVQSEDLANVNKELESFGFSVAHDLRNPLNGIGVCCEVIAKDVETTLGMNSKESIRHIVTGVHRMSQVITDLLALSRIGQQDFHRETINLSDMAQDLYAEFKSFDPLRKIEFVIKPDCVANADAGLVRILMENLVSNALKYSSRTTQTCIEFGSQCDNGQTTFFLKDNGVGFDMVDVDKLFKPFVRLHTDKDFNGTGIGLAISKRIVEKHHGKIWAKAEKDKGVTFYFRLE